jgi:NAD(P)-dependent dehydrogenase (short-subunit alcohol dehydrogenase family)
MAQASGARVVLITGAADGIGRATTRRFAVAGDRVAMLDFDRDNLNRAADELLSDGADVLAIQSDVRDGAAMDAAIAQTVARFGRLDVAVANAGIYPNCPVVDMEESEWDRVMDTNLKGTFLTCRAAARQMLAQGDGGKICVMASGAARSARVGAGHYCASKAGIVLFAQALALELAPQRINVNIIAPGIVAVGERPGVSAEYLTAITRGVPWGRAGEPDDVARVIEFVCSPAAEYMTGAFIPVDGGSSAGRYFLPLST